MSTKGFIFFTFLLACHGCKPLKKPATSIMQGAVLDSKVTEYQTINESLAQCLGDLFSKSGALLSAEAVFLQTMVDHHNSCIDLSFDAMAVDDASAQGQTLIENVGKCTNMSKAYLSQCQSINQIVAVNSVRNEQDAEDSNESGIYGATYPQQQLSTVGEMCALEKISSCVGNPNRTADGIADGISRNFQWITGKGCDSKPAVDLYNRYQGTVLLRLLAVQKGSLILKKYALSQSGRGSTFADLASVKLFEPNEMDCRYADQTEFGSAQVLVRTLENEFSAAKAKLLGQSTLPWKMQDSIEVEELLKNNRQAFAALCGNFEYSSAWEQFTSGAVVNLVANYAWINEVFSLSEEVPRITFDYFNARNPDSGATAGAVKSGYTLFDDFTEGHCFQKAIAENTQRSIENAQIWEIWKFDSSEIWSQLVDLIPMAGTLLSAFVDEQVDVSFTMVYRIRANTSKLLWIFANQANDPQQQAYYEDLTNAERLLSMRESGRVMRRALTIGFVGLSLIPGKKAILKAGVTAAKRYVAAEIAKNPILIRNLALSAANSREVARFIATLFTNSVQGLGNATKLVQATGPALSLVVGPIKKFLTHLSVLQDSYYTALPPSSVEKLYMIDDVGIREKIVTLFGTLHNKFCLSVDHCLASSQEIQAELKSWLTQHAPPGTDSAIIDDTVGQCFIH